MSGVDYGGTVVTGLLFSQEGGWDKSEWSVFPWDHFTESGVKLAREAGLTLIGRAKGKRMIIANGVNRVVFDTDVKAVENEDVISAQRSLIN